MVAAFAEFAGGVQPVRGLFLARPTHGKQGGTERIKRLVVFRAREAASIFEIKSFGFNWRYWRKPSAFRELMSVTSIEGGNFFAFSAV